MNKILLLLLLSFGVFAQKPLNRFEKEIVSYEKLAFRKRQSLFRSGLVASGRIRQKTKVVKEGSYSLGYFKPIWERISSNKAINSVLNAWDISAFSVRPARKSACTASAS